MSKGKKDKIIGYPYRYDVKADKYIPYPFKAGEEEKYIEKCLTVWGCIPHDVDWAINTKIYKS